MAEYETSNDLWYRFISDGMPAGEVRLPPEFTPFQIRSDTLIGVRADELDVEYVERWVVPPTVGGL